MKPQPSPAGWYPDPTGKPGQMYWDGQAWHTPRPAISATTRPAHARTPWGRVIFLVAGLVLVLPVTVMTAYAVQHHHLQNPAHWFGQGSSGGVAGSSPGMASLSPGQAKVTIDGQNQNLSGAVACNPLVTFDIYIGGPGDDQIMMSLTDPPKVQMVQFGTVKGITGVTAPSVSPLDPASNAEATKDGNSYRITGTATGDADDAPGMHEVRKQFEIDVTCP